MLGVILVIVVFLFCFVGPLIHHTDQLDPNLAATNARPGGKHLLGTDNNGYDILGRLMAGGQSSIEIGLSVACIATFLGVVYGAIAGYFGRLVDTVMMRIVDIMLAIPVVFLFIFISTVITPTTWLLILILAGLSWLAPARLVRGETLSLRTRGVRAGGQGHGGQVAAGSCSATSSPMPSAPSSSTPPSRWPTPSWSWPCCSTSALPCHRRLPPGVRCCPRGAPSSPMGTGGRFTRR